jgi:1,4-dihydroxy-2-naphthoate octaprenyltransferase
LRVKKQVVVAKLGARGVVGAFTYTVGYFPRGMESILH